MSNLTGSDLERQPLRQEQVGYDTLPSCPQNAPENRRKWNRLLIIVILTVLPFVLLFGYIVKYSPSPEAVETYFEDATNIEVRGLSFDGWYSNDHTRLDSVYEDEKPDGEKILKMRLQLAVWIDYSSASSINLSRRQLGMVNFLSESVVKNACFDLKNMTTYNDNSTSSQLLGFVHVPTRICVDLRDNVVTELDIPVFVRPKIKNLASVILKIWKKKYGEVKIWSDLNASLSKPLWHNWKLPMGNFDLKRLEWDDFINWERLYNRLRHSLSSLKEPIQVDNFEFNDNTDGFDFNIDVSCPLPQKDEWLKFPADFVLPPTVWKVRLPDCESRYSINLEHASFQTSVIDFGNLQDEAFFSTSISGQIKSPLPDELLYQVCSSDEENVVTPINLLLSKIFNNTELINFEVFGQEATNIQNSTFPIEYFNEILPILQFPIQANLTISSDELVEQVSVEELKLKWVQNKRGDKELAVMGEVIAIVNIPHFTSSKSGEESISIKKIKGLTKLYHEDRHFLTVPISVWKDAISEMVPSDELNKIQLQVSFDIANEEVEIVNRLQLTKCFNEMLIRGQAQVYVEGTLDLMTETKLGEIVFLV